MTIRLDFYQCALIRRRAADMGLTKSAYAANLVLRGLENESTARLPAVLDLLDDKLQRLDKVLNERSNTSRQGTGDVVQLQHQAFMIEVLILLRYLVRKRPTAPHRVLYNNYAHSFALMDGGDYGEG